MSECMTKKEWTTLILSLLIGAQQPLGEAITILARKHDLSEDEVHIQLDEILGGSEGSSKSFDPLRPTPTHSDPPA